MASHTPGGGLLRRGFTALAAASAAAPAAALGDGALRYGSAAGLTLAYLGFCLLTWQRHRSRQQRERAAAAALLQGTTGDAAPLLIAHASQTGTAERLAWQSAEALRQAGVPVQLLPLAALDAQTLRRAGRALFLVSTYGEGDPPDAALPFARRVMGQAPDLHGLQFGLLALGDSGYPHYCGFGRALGHWLRSRGATPLFDGVEVDNGDEGALRHWQHHLGLLGGRSDLADWQAPRYQPWRLVERRHLNPGSAGGAVWLIALEPPAATDWQAGDIAEIGPCNAPARVEQTLQRSGLDGSAVVDFNGEAMALRDALARAVLPEPSAGGTAEALAAQLRPLPHREYSIASLPDSGRLELVVRQMRHPDGRPGLGSGYLIEVAAPGDTVPLRLRSNPNFHPPADDRPLILIGNGTGIAGLRAHLLARRARGHRRNWLLFGERNRDCDYLFREQIEQWQREGHLQRVDLAFSRDEHPAYVQQRLLQAAGALRQWVADGAAIHVCGSLQGMAPAVHAVLTQVLGEAQLEALIEAGRYRRDVY